MKFYSNTGKTYQLATQIAKGGEGVVYEVDGQPSLVGKLYSTLPVSAEHHNKLKLLSQKTAINNSGHPVELLYEDRKTKVNRGYVMPKLEGKILANFNVKKSRESVTGYQYSTDFFMNIMTSFLKILEDVHHSGMVVGDINDANVLVRKDGTVAIIDVDSFQVGKHPCTVGRDEYTSPDLLGKDLKQVFRTPQHDLYSTSVLFWQLLFNGHYPYSGSGGSAGNELVKRIKAGVVIGHPHYQPPISQFSYKELPADIKHAFTESLGLRGQSAKDWLVRINQNERKLKRFIQRGLLSGSSHVKQSSSNANSANTKVHHGQAYKQPAQNKIRGNTGNNTYGNLKRQLSNRVLKPKVNQNRRGQNTPRPHSLSHPFLSWLMNSVVFIGKGLLYTSGFLLVLGLGAVMLNQGGESNESQNRSLENPSPSYVESPVANTLPTSPQTYRFGQSQTTSNKTANQNFEDRVRKIRERHTRQSARLSNQAPPRTNNLHSGSTTEIDFVERQRKLRSKLGYLNGDRPR